MKRVLLITFILVIFSGSAFAGHQGNYTGDCINCHTPNLIAQHGGFVGADCAKCHSSQDPTVMLTISKGIGGGIISCSDCHGLATHTQKHSDYFTTWTAYPGVIPASTGAWTQPTSFTYKNIGETTAQYQVCYMCHSSYSLGPSPNGNGVYDIVGPSGFNLTDQAMEFNPANKSAHPVEVPLNNLTGSYAPKALKSSQMSYPWTQVGNQIINCSDCHEVNPNGNPAAPQGANSLFPLKGTGKYWPTKSDGKTLWKLSSTDGKDSNLFCKNCHPLYSGGWKNQVHGEGDHSGYACVNCHVAVPHGSKRSRLIAYASDPAPYNYNNMAKMTQFKKSAGSYSESNCKAGCEDHESNVSNPDP